MSRFKILFESRNKRCCWLLIGENEEKVESRVSMMLPFTGPSSTQEATDVFVRSQVGSLRRCVWGSEVKSRLKE